MDLFEKLPLEVENHIYRFLPGEDLRKVLLRLQRKRCRYECHILFSGCPSLLTEFSFGLSSKNAAFAAYLRGDDALCSASKALCEKPINGRDTRDLGWGGTLNPSRGTCEALTRRGRRCSKSTHEQHFCAMHRSTPAQWPHFWSPAKDTFVHMGTHYFSETFSSGDFSWIIVTALAGYDDLYHEQHYRRIHVLNMTSENLVTDFQPVQRAVITVEPGAHGPVHLATEDESSEEGSVVPDTDDSSSEGSVYEEMSDDEDIDEDIEEEQTIAEIQDALDQEAMAHAMALGAVERDLQGMHPWKGWLLQRKAVQIICDYQRGLPDEQKDDRPASFQAFWQANKHKTAQNEWQALDPAQIASFVPRPGKRYVGPDRRSQVEFLDYEAAAAGDGSQHAYMAMPQCRCNVTKRIMDAITRTKNRDDNGWLISVPCFSCMHTRV